MKKILQPVALTLCAILGGVSLPSCGDGGLEEVGEDIDEAADDVEDELDDIGD